ncbi:MAG: hypothetical protein CMO74_09790 [Verrucomicrobiales bacterium]|nr:hypothetical protein [Verrucomicrobiales bacterium]
MDLDNNKIAELAPLSGLKNLRTLNLTGNQIRKLKALATLPLLREINLNNNQPLYVFEVADLREIIPRVEIQHTATQTEIQFVNRTKTPVTIRWVNFGGELETYRNGLQPGAGYAQNTYIGHHWVIYDPDGKELGRTTATAQITTWEVTERGLKLVPKRSDLPRGSRPTNN